MELHNKIEEKFRLDIKQKKALHKLKIFSVADLLFHFPVRYSDISEVKKISELISGDMATIYGKVSKLKTKKGFRSRMPMAEGEIEDLSGKIKIIWFNQAYLAKMIKDGENVKLTGKVTQGKQGVYLANPEFEKMPDMPIDTHDTLFRKDKVPNAGFSYPIYAETRGITSKWFYHAIEKIFKEKTLDDITDTIPQDILKKYHLPALKTALVWIHKPKNKNNSESARKRFAFEEVFCIQLERQHDKFEYRKNKSFQIKKETKNTEEFIKRFLFEPTNSQKKSINTILEDMARAFPMSRLLEGDVGSGKTAVAATASYVTVQQRPNGQSFGNLQVAYMAPTEILATQHFESFIEYFKHLPINIGLITGSGCRKFPSKVNPGGWTTISRAQLLKWVDNGEIPILIGTHALIQKTVKFKNLALVVIDEQHRFGTAQRRKLVRKDNIAPHLLSMTATPIPRTLALTIYGDLDLSLLDEMPAGRKQIITEIITPNKRENTYEEIRQELTNGRQLYVICPRIFEPDPEKELALNVKSAVAEAKRLKKEVFQEYEIGVLHSKMSKEKKEEVMRDFTENKINILCATSVVEVGVNVPNATIIIIEGAERFGLAQLHQLRGRVIRSTHQAYCYIFAEAKSEKTVERLKALKTAKNGFELAELDLALRGAGELGGTKQWGITDLGMEAIKNIKMVEAARTEAIRLIEEDPELKKYPLLKQKVREKASEFHFE
ncbi:MAG: ATP-dependent DNA helicase RecG [Parcubacteria group bacterium GW2011_GWF1_40_6]|uniref:Probable DNA 3'-5' helicase RecG n=2 Tax=Candidatus Nomuraibacteriota TaxID=1752729 RepID=A0A0G0T5D0_9BACT|nr:MAG: ATP-dependent DNA helicase RecG [Candidatus Nomurabacteria bacterium GW2011_GWF2_40_12]KKR69176.1 MAG: ATP-dependent DNA helicase RecG [Parcubacteria group bacterium GW2011_GWF1_40_6]OGJ09465.1 MAG: ATP-dependent DNA helicase RecG [Candidatus Nomurabacteria bacterium RIFOXYB1_FULL_39_16]OGJ14513.1 MAG: ATP-dependent DNA helicase RecG [Candidatus Nomurabacteria bacterium RIFOXYD1_FULL_39_12]